MPKKKGEAERSDRKDGEREGGIGVLRCLTTKLPRRGVVAGAGIEPTNAAYEAITENQGGSPTFGSERGDTNGDGAIGVFDQQSITEREGLASP